MYKIGVEATPLIEEWLFAFVDEKISVEEWTRLFKNGG